MSILFDQSKGCFHLSNGRVSYIFRLAGGKYPVHVHWGRRVRAVTDELIERRTIWTEDTFCLNETVMDFLPMECPTFGGDLREGMIHVIHESGYSALLLELAVEAYGRGYSKEAQLEEKTERWLYLTELMEKINYYKELLADPVKLQGVLREELIAIRDKFGDERRTELLPLEDEIMLEDLIERHTCVISMTHTGYIKRQLAEVARKSKLEDKKLPEDLDYNTISGLRLEARQKLNAVRPLTVGQASRISGVSPADISVLLLYLGIK